MTETGARARGALNSPRLKRAIRKVAGSLALVPLLSVLGGCSSAEGDEAPPLGHTDQAFESVVDCQRESTLAYDNGSAIGSVELIHIDGMPATVRTGHAFLALQRLAASHGIDVRISSGFRTMAEQQHLWQCYQSGSCNHGNLAAKPGYSNHQSGTALDLTTPQRSALDALIKSQGLPWKKTVPSEAWHYEYQGTDVAGPCG